MNHEFSVRRFNPDQTCYHDRGVFDGYKYGFYVHAYTTTVNDRDFMDRHLALTYDMITAATIGEWKKVYDGESDGPRNFSEVLFVFKSAGDCNEAFMLTKMLLPAL